MRLFIVFVCVLVGLSGTAATAQVLAPPTLPPTTLPPVVKPPTTRTPPTNINPYNIKSFPLLVNPSMPTLKGSLQGFSNNLFSAYPLENSLYDRATRCTKGDTPGIRRLEQWMIRYWAGQSWGTYRCEKWGPDSASSHAEGRALDWNLDWDERADRRQGLRFIRALLASDAQGNQHALARRMGIQEIIWGCHYWGAGMQGFRIYSLCYRKDRVTPKRVINRTVGHIDHLHIGITKDAARLRTSFWSSTGTAQQY